MLRLKGGSRDSPLLETFKSQHIDFFFILTTCITPPAADDVFIWKKKGLTCKTCKQANEPMVTGG